MTHPFPHPSPQPGRAHAHRRAWLRLLLVVMLLSGLQGLLGRWVAQASASPGQVLVEVCTVAGMQWVAVDDTTGPADPLNAAESLQPCVWVAAGVSLPAPPSTAWGTLTWTPTTEPWARLCQSAITPDTIARVLLMAPMRAPPLRSA